MAHHYFLIDNGVLQLTDIRIACFAEHAKQTNNLAELSEVLSLDGTERLIKVANPSAEWILAQDWVDMPDVTFWHGAQGDPDTDALREAWGEAQLLDFDSNQDNQPDTSQQRKSWWQRLMR